MDHYISMYIDNELSLEEKIVFLEHVHGNRAFKEGAVSLLEQEKLLRPALERQTAGTAFSPHPGRRSLRSIGLAMAAGLLLVFSFLAGTNFQQHNQNQQNLTSIIEEKTMQHRFVLFDKESEKIEITGSFTHWQKLPLTPAGPGGYWEITLAVPEGEHRYSFIKNGGYPLPDPTVATQEADDFGTINSILNVES